MKDLVISVAILFGMAMISNVVAGSPEIPDAKKLSDKVETMSHSSNIPADSTNLNLQIRDSAERSRTTAYSDVEMFEKTVNIIKEYESLHKAEHYPLVGYGHKVRKGEKYSRGVELSAREADRLLRKDLREYVKMYSKHGSDAYLLAALAYNCGHGRVDKSQVIAKLKRGDRDIRNAYLSHSRAGGKFHRQLYERRKTEFNALYVP